MPTWADFFSPRLLLSICTILETLFNIQNEIIIDLGLEKGIIDDLITPIPLELHTKQRNGWIRITALQ